MLERSPDVGGRARPYDFRRPKKFGREHVRALQIVHEAFARQLATLLSTTLRTVVQVAVASVEQRTSDEYVRTLPNPTALAVLDLEPLPASGLLHVPLPLAMTFIDRTLGGDGSGSHPRRGLTEIETVLVRDLIARAATELGAAFEPLLPLRPTVTHVEANPQFAPTGPASDVVAVVTFEVRLGGGSHELSLCLPFSALQPALEQFGGAGGDQDGVHTTGTEIVAGALERAPVQVQVRFSPVTLTSREIVELRPGDVLPLHHATAAPLTVLAEGVPLFAAQPGRRGKRLACRIVDPEANA